MDSIVEVQIELVSIDLNENMMKKRYTYYDVYGLDAADLADHLLVRAQNGFKAWYVLQHYDQWKGYYKPFVDIMSFEMEYMIEE